MTFEYKLQKNDVKKTSALSWILTAYCFCTNVTWQMIKLLPVHVNQSVTAYMFFPAVSCFSILFVKRMNTQKFAFAMYAVLFSHISSVSTLTHTQTCFEILHFVLLLWTKMRQSSLFLTRLTKDWFHSWVQVYSRHLQQGGSQPPRSADHRLSGWKKDALLVHYTPCWIL